MRSSVLLGEKAQQLRVELGWILYHAKMTSCRYFDRLAARNRGREPLADLQVPSGAEFSPDDHGRSPDCAGLDCRELGKTRRRLSQSLRVVDHYLSILFQQIRESYALVE